MGQEVEEIKERADIVEVISEYVKLTKAGGNFRACCPFHNEKTPSFMVSPSKNVWHCFGCGEGGDVFSFVEKIEGLDFYGALKLLAKRTGVKLSGRESPQEMSKKGRLLDLLNLAELFYRQSLLRSKAGQAAREYVDGRGITAETSGEFGLGYAPNFWDAVVNFLAKRGYAAAEVAAAGLAAPRDGGGFYDRFRNRLIFPIHDIHGGAIGFGGRILGDDKQTAKYINSPQSLVYDKSRVVYGLDKAKQAIREEDKVVIVEGYMDVISSHQAGVENVVAASGTALTGEQLRILGRYTKNLCLAFDMDVAGDTATKRGIDEALAQDFRVMVGRVPGGKDPDECIRQRGVEVWRGVIAKATSVVDYYFESAMAGKDLSQPEDKKAVVETVGPILGSLSSAVEKAHYTSQLAMKLGMKEEIIEREIERIGQVERVGEARRPINGRDNEGTKPKNQGREDKAAMRMLGILIENPRFLENAARRRLGTFLASDFQALYKALKEYYSQNNANYETAGFLASLKEANSSLGLLAEKSLLYYESLGEVEPEEVDFCARRIEEKYCRKKLVRLEMLMKQAEQAGREEEVERLNREFTTISGTLTEIMEK